MNGLVLLESLQYVEDGLLEEAEAPARKGSPRLRRGAVAACVAALACGGLLLRGALESRAEPGVFVTAGPAGSVFLPEPTGYIPLPQYTGEDPGHAQSGIRPMNTPRPGTPVGTPGDLTPPPERGEPEVFAYSYFVDKPGLAEDADGIILVGQELTEAQLTACTPGERLTWMEGFTGSAVYRLADGSGGLNGVELSVAREGRTYRVTLREATAERLAAFGLDGETLPMMDGQGYAAFRDAYVREDGERVSILAAFEKAGVLYTLAADVPGEEEKAAAIDLRDLFLAYERMETAPDLGSFAYRK